MDSYLKEIEREAQNSIFEQSLTKEEIQMFETIAEKEMIHNELGSLLGSYRDSIVETRNKFVEYLSNKYKLEDPGRVTYDPATQKIVSVFHPNIKAHKINSRPDALVNLASALMMEAIQKLGEAARFNRK